VKLQKELKPNVQQTTNNGKFDDCLVFLLLVHLPLILLSNNTDDSEYYYSSYDASNVNEQQQQQQQLNANEQAMTTTVQAQETTNDNDMQRKSIAMFRNYFIGYLIWFCSSLKSNKQTLTMKMMIKCFRHPAMHHLYQTIDWRSLIEMNNQLNTNREIM
jgi:inner membrane protein involved in colicin E2 resistance